MGDAERYSFKDFDWYAVLDYFQKQEEMNFCLLVDGDSFRLAIGETTINDLDKLSKKLSRAAYGFFTYDLKNSFESLSSDNHDYLGWEDVNFFLADIEWDGSKDKVKSPWLMHLMSFRQEKAPQFELKDYDAENYQSINKRVYLDKLESLQNHIKQGDIYEVNFCCAGTHTGEIDPVKLGLRLISITDAPFAGIMKIGKKWVLCGSPERYIKREGNKLSSQPIKGTAKRMQDANEDRKAANDLYTSEKDRAENIMIVDLVRNDLSRVARSGTVTVEELCAIKSYRTVHQLVSTISCEIDEDVHLKEILKASYPMGSMTGAPKLSAMQLIEKHEDFKRGPYSGSMGYITANGDFDFNVLIRSIFYDEGKKIAMFPSGGAITIESDPELEYEEMCLKMEAMQQAFDEE